nr:hypothetical protein [bacterium]
MQDMEALLRRALALGQFTAEERPVAAGQLEAILEALAAYRRQLGDEAEDIDDACDFIIEHLTCDMEDGPALLTTRMAYAVLDALEE